MTKTSLGNALPTEAERERMFALLNKLRERLGARGHDLAPPVYNASDDTVELRQTGGFRERVVAWADAGKIFVWRHPTLRDERDDALIYGGQ